jgi:DNA-directed RNA polymerase subunit RPC12/RpoP
MNDALGKPVSTKEVVCPYCGSHDTEFYSLFGQQLLTMQYYCNNCHTPFEYVKDDEAQETHTELYH